MTACLIVRAKVAEADRAAFDHWYETEHLPDAAKAFKATGAERGWSDGDPCLHVALYRFNDLETATSVIQSDAMKDLIAEFDRVWQGRVVRTREVIDLVQSLS